MRTRAGAALLAPLASVPWRLCVAGAALAATALAGAAGGYAFARRRTPAPDAAALARARPAPPDDVVDAALAATLTAVVILDGDDVVWTNPAADAMRVVRDGPARHRAGRGWRAGRSREQVPREADVDLPDGRDVRSVHVVAAPAGSRVALLADDKTEARRVDAVRRDFVANVSHELKTPVGALSLLAETIQDAADDPEAVTPVRRPHAARGRAAAALVQDLIDLSRLQGAEPHPAPSRCRSTRSSHEAVDRARLAARRPSDIDARRRAATDGLTCRGRRRRCSSPPCATCSTTPSPTAPSDTRVGVGARRRGDDGRDQRDRPGHRHPRHDQERDLRALLPRRPGPVPRDRRHRPRPRDRQARRRQPRRRVDVWSVEGTGSTFTLRLPTFGGRRVRARGTTHATPGAAS